MGGCALALMALPLTTMAPPADASTNITIATGNVTDSFGSALPGAEVDVYAWPDDTTLQNLAIGQAVPTTLLATTTADSNGNFTLSVPPSALLNAAVSGTWANLEADAGDGVWFFTIDTANPVPDNFTIQQQTGALRPTCGPWVYNKQLTPEWGPVGQGYVGPNATGVTMGFTYSKGQSSTIGIGLSVNGGAAGTYSASGSNTESTNTTVIMPSYGAGNYVHWLTQWRIAKYHMDCPGGVVKYHVRSNGWKGSDATTFFADAPSALHCTTWLAGTTFTTSNASAENWTGDVAVSIGEVSFDAHIHTGYDSSDQISFKFTKDRSLCGTNDNPSYARQIVAKQ